MLDRFSPWRSIPWLRALSDLVYPPRCLADGCGRPGAWLCRACAAGVERLQPPLCPRCALPAAATGEASGCPDCLRAPPAFDRCFAAASYAPPVDALIRALKYRRAATAASPLARLLKEAIGSPLPDLDGILPVPSHRSRIAERGLDHAGCLAEALAEQLDRPLARGLLVRSRATGRQVGRSARQRLSNVAGAFVLPRGSEMWRGRHLLLVDDVMTTGATAGQAAAALVEAGVGRVSVAVVARALPPWQRAGPGIDRPAAGSL